MLRIVQFTQITFCLVSMILTSLFALSLSGANLGGADTAVTSLNGVLSSGLFILIGACIDSGKYLFWVERERNFGYLAISLVLTLFSLLASCAFFVSAEKGALDDSRVNTPEYLAFQARIESIQDEIAYHERLIESRLNSQFHSQWAEGERNSEELGELKNSLAILIESSSEVGQEASIEMVPMSDFFSALGAFTGTKIDTVRNICYGLLALLLEVSTLGAISLTNSLRVERHESNQNGETSSEPQIKEDPDFRQKSARLSQDIVDGRVKPVIRRIKASNYGLDFDEIKLVLARLYSAGLIEQDARSSYKLRNGDQD